MANKDERFEDNVPGPWYVDRQCISCGLCADVAPGIFAMSQDGDHNFVFHQPSTPEELGQAMEALEGCPVEAIGKDGVESEAGVLLAPGREGGKLGGG